MKMIALQKAAQAAAILLSLALVLSAAGCRGGLRPATSADSAPPMGLSRAADWRPGLAVVYLPGKFRHTDEMPAGDHLLKLGRPGAPIPVFNNSFGRGEVFASGRTQAIGLEASGFIHLAQPGTYGFKALSNDGIRVWIADHLVVDDGEWHSSGDRFSAPLTVEIAQPGWAAMRLRYFQRKGTAALKLYWQPPGAEAFTVIPAEAYAHGPSPG